MWSIEFSKTHHFQIHNNLVKQKLMSDFWNVCFCVCDCAARCWEVYRHWKALPLPEAAFWSQQWQWQKVRVRLHDCWLQCCCAALGFVIAVMTLLSYSSSVNEKKTICRSLSSRFHLDKVLCILLFLFLLYLFFKKRSASESLQTLFFQLCGSCWWWSKPLICVDILLYLVVCVSFVSPYLFITHTPPRPPQFGPFGLRMPGGRPLLDYGINLFLF